MERGSFCFKVSNLVQRICKCPVEYHVVHFCFCTTRMWKYTEFDIFKEFLPREGGSFACNVDCLPGCLGVKVSS